MSKGNRFCSCGMRLIDGACPTHGFKFPTPEQLAEERYTTSYGYPLPYVPHEPFVPWKGMCGKDALLRVDIECNSGTGARRVVGKRLNCEGKITTFMDAPLPRAVDLRDLEKLAGQIAASLYQAWNTWEDF